MKNKFLFLFLIALFVFGFSMNIYADTLEENEEATIVTGTYNFDDDIIPKSESELNKEKWVNEPESLKQRLFLYISLGIIFLNFIVLVKIIVGIVKDYNIPSILNKKE